MKKVEEHIADAKAHGGEVITGGSRHELGQTFFQPTVITGVTTEMKVTSEETFGPVAPLFKFHDEDEAISMANNTQFGLASYFYARDLGRVWRVAEALESGIVGINEGIISNEVAPFGGIKESGIGLRGLQVRHRRLHRDQVPVHGRHRRLIGRCRRRAGLFARRFPVVMARPDGEPGTPAIGEHHDD